ncbi:ABC transporter permease [Scatolibacter rhodanostii]|uniref:ABC transporter permease n=1 Tax=Scatolibacter rhodanostii TaxID=2014781 RepID=UPI000C083412|nr:ABC transporter permease subunit [Scatolibacter rhodanostii]
MKMTHLSQKNSFKPKKMPFGRYIKNNYDLYIMLLPALAFIIIFAYLPMYGVLMAFQDFNPAQGIAGSPWVGLKHFERFFSIYTAKQIIVNTIVLSLYSIIVSFPFPIILALMLNYSVSKRFGKMVQTVTYIPYFISITVLIGMMNIFFSPNYGIVNTVISALGGTTQTFMSDSSWFRHLYVWSGVWQNMGYSAIVYIAALSSVDPTLYEAATLDGASKLQRMRYIDIPTIMPTCVIMLLLSLGSIMGVGFEKVYLMQNDRNSAISEVISTYVYKVGLLDGRYSFSSAVNLFNSIINFTLLIFVNKVSKKISDISLW